ncbi:replicative DNA helicase [Metabacillus halosaccharovorans]|uniref:replicative DNA helicase n=1 Tax=Metabacillus halosaccharovorans TaxID=930124 RepID=UPI0009952BD9|nr:DnaB-like helicase C-terminal domain-containing protein [Metabacillus halosaccharovorans]
MNSTGANDLNAEQSVLGAVFLDSNVLDQIVFLEDRDFQIGRHREIYKAMRKLEKNSVPIDLVTVTEELDRTKMIENVGGVNYLSQLAESCPTTANVEFYAKAVRSKAMERRIKDTSVIIGDMSRADYESDEEFFSYVEQLVTQLRPQDNARMKSFSQSKSDYFEYLAKKNEFIKTGFEQFDKWAHGAWRGWLWVLAGRPSVGKTAMLLQRIYGMAKQHKGVILIFSQEMKKESLIDRMISNSTGVSFNKIKTKNLNERERNLVEMAYENFEYLPIHFQDSAGVTIEEVRATAKQFKKKYGRIAAIAVDYLQIMRIPQKNGESRSQAIGNVTGEAKRIAMDLDCCFIMLSQMSRAFEKELKPQLSHLKESGSIEQDADMVEFLWHDPSDTAMGGKVIQQTFAKGRDTGLNDFRLLFQGWIQRFNELPRK